MGWDILIVDEKVQDTLKTIVFIVETGTKVKRILVETRDHYEHVDACLNPGNTRVVVLKMVDIDGERNEYIDVYDPATLRPVISLINWPVDKIAFSRDGKLMYLQATLETGTPIEAVLDLFSGDKVEGASRTKDGASLVRIAGLLKQRKRTVKEG
jgi:hypothetical protein